MRPTDGPRRILVINVARIGDSLPWKVKFVTMKAGDLLLFNSLLAHGIRQNTSTDKVRLAQ